MKLYEMEGFLHGKCVPGDLLVNETNAEYLVRKFTELHDRIEVTTAALREKTKQCDQLAAENAGLKGAISQHAAGFTVCEACGEENVSGNDDVCRVLNETPATDAFLREVRAQGVEMFSEQQRSYIGKPSKNDAASSYCSREALQFAAQLHKGGAA
ncbi:hypothetical protein SMC00_003696 [Cronobacter sakazakii]|nr:hypothetical protein [Cronobacter sakazakii]ELY2757973.1 hypothetical protein [Cronobacter sakazakii]ELY3999457.1 hypothetical protein [Cronobacter sakazakii]ELY4070502.1 hypothetical protein [Cronobacter sakazakii]ELY4847841.1 hypothetical protein [Cronobacter sakazakii]